jgi:hypothetical protein
VEGWAFMEWTSSVQGRDPAVTQGG